MDRDEAGPSESHHEEQSSRSADAVDLQSAWSGRGIALETEEPSPLPPLSSSHIGQESSFARLSSNMRPKTMHHAHTFTASGYKTAKRPPRAATGEAPLHGPLAAARGRPSILPSPRDLFKAPSNARTLSFIDPGPSASAPRLGNMEQETMTWRATAVGSTPLDKTIDAIGMGRYQWALLVLSGCGYVADNMWLQGVAIILPRVQDEFDIPDRWIGLVSSSTFAGMMVGALAWGSYADTFGRKNAFNGTLFVTAVFGCLSAFASSFPMLCLWLFLLGTGVGGSMPTDGTLFLENLPKRKQYLLTALSVFFAVGSVVTSVLALIIVPSRSCPDKRGSATTVKCDVGTQNSGWRWLLASLGLLTVLFVVARLIFFRLFESPKFLVASGRPHEARVVLQRIAAFNGAPLPVSLCDVQDGERGNTSHIANRSTTAGKKKGASSWLGMGGDAKGAAYQSVPTDDTAWCAEEAGPSLASEAHLQNGVDDLGDEEDAVESPTNRPLGTSHLDADTPSSSLASCLPASWQSGFSDFASRYEQLFTPEWRRTTMLVWAIWTLLSLAYTMFNVFLPKLLEARLGGAGSGAEGPSGVEEVLRDYVWYAISSLPGSILGAWAIETRLGRRGSMALSLGGTAVSILFFAFVGSRLAIVISSMAVSLAATTGYAALYGYTPEVFATDVRGTACGSASALSRLAGILAPVIAGTLLSISVTLPLVLSVILLLATALCALALPIETRGRTQEGGEVAGLH